MDIAKYAGLFLLKNEYCFLPGLGSFMIKRKPAKYDSQNMSLEAPEFEVTFQIGGGAIDDSFSNFIANNERVSIAHASNHLKSFCASAKSQLMQGQAVEFPGLGKIINDKDNNPHFIAESNLNIKGKSIPIFKNSEGLTDRREKEAISNIIKQTVIAEPKGDDEIIITPPQVNWGKVILVSSIILAIVSVIVYLILNSLNNDKIDRESLEDVAPKEQPVQTMPIVDTQKNDTTMIDGEDTAQVETERTVANNNIVVGGLQVIINTYPTAERADRRVAQLESFGNKNLRKVTIDSATHHVVITLEASLQDSLRMQDSLKRLFNPGGTVSILK